MVTIIKANKQTEAYNEKKIAESIKRTRIPKSLQDAVVNHVNTKIHENMTTDEIYNEVSNYLGSSEIPYAKSLYQLKKAIMELGPTGYPFEDFFSEILIEKGYKTQVRQILHGKCISHEIDVLAKRAQSQIMVETKFHNAPGSFSDVHVPMYTKSRYDDLKRKHHLTNVWIVTNTHMTTDAIAFAECTKMKVISWNYPDEGSLRDLIEEVKFHPITLLSSLTTRHKAILLDHHVVRCKMIHNNPAILNLLPLSNQEKNDVIAEVHFICKDEHDE